MPEKPGIQPLRKGIVRNDAVDIAAGAAVVEFIFLDPQRALRAIPLDRAVEP